jgi:hypothetical protein
VKAIKLGIIFGLLVAAFTLWPNNEDSTGVVHSFAQTSADPHGSGGVGWEWKGGAGGGGAAAAGTTLVHANNDTVDTLVVLKLFKGGTSKVTATQTSHSTSGKHVADTLQATEELRASENTALGNEGTDEVVVTGVLDLNGTDLTATFAEVNQALDGIGVTVTDGNLDELTDGSETTLHSHAAAGSASDTLTGPVIVGPVTLPDRPWQQVYDNGGCGNCKAILAMDAYGDSVFFADTRGTFGYVGMWDGTNAPTYYELTGSREPYAIKQMNDFLYVGTGYSGTDGDIIRYNRYENTWVEVDSDLAQAVLSFETLNGYFFAGSGTTAGSAKIYRSDDGITFSAVYTGAATIREAGTDLVVHDGLLFASLYTTTFGSDIIFSADSGDTWQTLGSPAPGNRIEAMASYNGFLWVTTSGVAAGASAYYYDDTGLGWTTAKTLTSTYDSGLFLLPYHGRLFWGVGDSGTSTGSIKVFDGAAYNDSIVGNPEVTIGKGAISATIWRDEIVTGWGDPVKSANGTADIWTAFYGTPGSGRANPVPSHFPDRVTFHDIAAFSSAPSPSTISTRAQIWAEDIGGAGIELWGIDGSGNIAAITPNVNSYPADMAVSSTRPYVTQSDNRNTHIRTYKASHRAYEILQEIAWREGLIPRDEFLIKHVDRRNPGKLVQSVAPPTNITERRSLLERMLGD